MAAFSMRTIVDVPSAVAVALHARCPRRQPSPKKLPYSRTPTTASFPCVRAR